jgi:exonuclease I
MLCSVHLLENRIMPEIKFKEESTRTFFLRNLYEFLNRTFEELCGRYIDVSTVRSVSELT